MPFCLCLGDQSPLHYWYDFHNLPSTQAVVEMQTTMAVRNPELSGTLKVPGPLCIQEEQLLGVGAIH